ncbi:MAG: low molecular weight phosphotyrosine protein phosphatase [Ardenticatenaceae bacterium]|nr:low molecular weight phosphotyrosine protein phosphatase [Ardenticatenaceae bacterium]MCB8986841.1 low molecular weight phosphotyrosine protein phosphatase [Ardenticatenaceae bacterium]
MFVVKMPSILVVCTANICRSPVAAALLRDRLQKRGLADWVVRSAGTWAEESVRASRYSVELAAERGLDITGHRAEMVNRQLLKEADLVLCMETGHAEALRVEFPGSADKIYLMSEMVGKKYGISDPYGRSRATYEAMVTELENIIDAGLDEIIARAEKTAAQRSSTSPR